MYASSLENAEALIHYVIIINFSLRFNLPLKAEMMKVGKNTLLLGKVALQEIKGEFQCFL